VSAHAYLSFRAPATYIVPIVIEPINDGIYGYRTKATIPKIAGGADVQISGQSGSAGSGPYGGEPHPSLADAKRPGPRKEPRRVRLQAAQHSTWG
jgi:hypothetical protein